MDMFSVCICIDGEGIDIPLCILQIPLFIRMFHYLLSILTNMPIIFTFISDLDLYLFMEKPINYPFKLVIWLLNFEDVMFETYL